MLDRRSLILGVAVSLMLPPIEALAAPKDKDKDKGGGKSADRSNKGGNSGGNNGGSNNGGSNNGGAGKAKGKANGNANGAANGNGTGNANANSNAAGSQYADEALKAVENGNAMPLRNIQAMIEPQYPGVLIEAQLQRRGAVFFYDLTMLSPQGRVYVVTVEAATGLVIGR